MIIIEKVELINAIEKLIIEFAPKPITYKDIGKVFDLSGESIRRWINKYELQEELPDCFVHIHKKFHHFDEINKESAYWIGYLMADGCLSINRGNKRLMLECKIEDKEILEKFCDFLGIRKDRITLGHKGRSAALCIANNRFSTSVETYGIFPNKSHLENHLPSFCENDELFFQFLKGIIDGDGTIHTQRGSTGISFVNNSITFCEEVKQKLIKVLPYPSSVWILSHRYTGYQPLYFLKIGSGGPKRINLMFLFEKFYSDSKIILERKYTSFKKIL